MVRTLCPHCLESVEAAALVEVGGARVCAPCAARVARHGGPGVPDAPALRGPLPGPGRGGTWREALVAACVGRIWWIRAPVLLYLAYVGVRQALQPLHPGPADMYVSWFDGINFGFHELGHYVFRPFGRFFHVFGGTLLQCLMPLVAGFLLLRQRDPFGLAFCVGWLSTNLSGVAVYMADARVLQLEIVAPGVGVVDDGMKGQMHDWANLLRMTGLLPHAEGLATFVKVLAAATMLAALAFGAWVCLTMARTTLRPSRR